MLFVNLLIILLCHLNKVSPYSTGGLIVALAFEVNAGACDSYLREFIDPLKFLTCVKGTLTLTSIPLNSDGLDIEGIILY